MARARTGYAASQAESGVVPGIAQHIRQGLLKARAFLFQSREKLAESIVNLVSFFLLAACFFNAT
jgi:hypothetical protein